MRLIVAAGAASGVLVGLGAAQTAAPIARYDMRAGTSSGIMGGMAGMRGGGMGAAMGMAFGGGGNRNAPQHELWLELGSSRAPAGGSPKADHFMPAGAKLGPSVPLNTPVKGPSGPELPPEQRDFKRPKGRILIFWGCGEHAPTGQPIVIDFAKMAAGQMPPGLWSSNVPMDRRVSYASSKTYGSWPNSEGKTSVRTDSSLLGAHRVAGNYAPEMNFTLTRDFMGALKTSTATMPSGATLLRWNLLPDATGYHASLIGGKMERGSEMSDMVWWSSSSTREFGGGLSDWLSPGTVARLVASRTVLAPATSSCMVPAEVKAAAPQFQMVSLYAYGPEESFVYPPRPANPKTPWKPEWTADIRHRSMTGLLLGMPGMDGADDDNGRGDKRQQQCQPKPRKRGLGGLGGLIGGALGAPVGGNGDGC
ncbi:MAG: hypothetical protein K2X68_08855 [Novosphingobium sp.]|nr:hypothetical protein [Novosphingobium sp.]